MSASPQPATSLPSTAQRVSLLSPPRRISLSHSSLNCPEGCGSRRRVTQHSLALRRVGFDEGSFITRPCLSLAAVYSLLHHHPFSLSLAHARGLICGPSWNECLRGT